MRHRACPQRIIGCETPEDNRVTFVRRSSVRPATILRASGNVHLQIGIERLSAASAEYNTATGTGRLQARDIHHVFEPASPIIT